VPTYRVSVATLTATDYGVAQKRSRVFLVGVRDDVARRWEAPSATHGARELNVAKWITGEYWRRHGLPMPEMDASASAFLRRHNQDGGSEDLFAPRLEPHLTVRDALVGLPDPAGGSGGHPDHEAAPREARAYKGHTGSPIDEPSKTLRAGVHGVSGGENMIDYGEGAADLRYRHFTVREAARIQSFDDGYRFPGTWSDGLKQLGNAVPVGLGQAVGRSLARVLS
jgi:DNA (cytosine-5)-methyltransferase 1